MVAEEVDRLKSLAEEQPRRSVLWAWYKSAGNRWAVTRRNAIGALIRDVELVLGVDDDPELDTFSELSTERLLRGATGADCWMIRDPLSAVFDDRAVHGRRVDGNAVDRPLRQRSGSCVRPGRLSVTADGAVPLAHTFWRPTPARQASWSASRMRLAPKALARR